MFAPAVLLTTTALTLFLLLGSFANSKIKNRLAGEDTTSSSTEMSRYQRILDIKRKTRLSIAIEDDEDKAEGRFNPQLPNCPLFTKLPREIRDQIWAYATAPYEDPNGAFEKTAYYYRPGHTARLQTDTALLRTCRRIWIEANAMPMLQAEQSFYYKRPAPDRRDPQWMKRLTSKNREDFGHLHLFVQMYLIEGLDAERGSLRHFFLKKPLVPGDFQPKMFHVTLRHTDFWFWERDEPLRLQDSWVQAMLNSPDLRSTEVFKLELETLDYKVPQLLPIVERLKRTESKLEATHLIDDKPMKTKFVLSDTVEEYDWEGPSNIDKQDFDPYKDRANLKYHVMTLTWKLTFPDIPRANVAKLRRSPRTDASSGADGDNQDSEKGTSYWHYFGSSAEAEARLRETPRTRRLRIARPKPSRLSRLWHVSARQAEATEAPRRRTLENWIARVETEKWEAKWEKEKSLLSFTKETCHESSRVSGHFRSDNVCKASRTIKRNGVNISADHCSLCTHGHDVSCCN